MIRSSSEPAINSEFLSASKSIKQSLITRNMSAFPKAFSVLLLLELTAFQVGLTQQCQADVVVTSLSSLSNQITSAVNNSLSHYTCPDPAYHTRLEAKIDALTSVIASLSRKLDKGGNNESSPSHEASPVLVFWSTILTPPMDTTGSRMKPVKPSTVT